MSEERKRILKMVEEGKIGVEEADELLKTMDGGNKKKEVLKKVNPKFLKILVEEEGEEKVDISIPFSLARTALKFMPKSAKERLEEKEINIKKIIDSIEGELDDNTLVNINDGDTRVVIKIE